jgi:hypothetical protein
MARYTVTLPAGQASVTVTPATFGPMTFYDGQVIESDVNGYIATALSGNLRALSATAGSGGCGNKDTMAEAWAASNASS